MGEDKHRSAQGASAMARFSFHGDELEVIPSEGQVHVVIRRVCEALGLDVSSQLQKLKGHPAISVVMIAMQVPGDDQRREFACIDVRSLPLWLATIHASKVRPELQAKLVAYQREAADVLADHFLGRRAAPPPPAPVPQAPWPRLEMNEAEKAALLFRFLEMLPAGVCPEVRSVAVAHGVAMLTGTRVAPMLPELAGRWKRPTEIHGELGVRLYDVSQAIKELGLKDIPERRKVILDTKAHGKGGQVECFLYDEQAVEMIRAHIACPTGAGAQGEEEARQGAAAGQRVGGGPRMHGTIEQVLAGEARYALVRGDNRDLIKAIPDESR